MRAYPTVATTPNRKQRKSQRHTIFAENKYALKAAKSAARRERQKVK